MTQRYFEHEGNLHNYETGNKKPGRKKKKLYYQTADGYLYNSITKQTQHREVIETILGRALTENETVHHIDSNKANNTPSNLAILTHKQHGDYNGFIIQHYSNQVSFREWLKSRDLQTSIPFLVVRKRPT